MRTATTQDVLAGALRELRSALAPLRVALADDPLRLALPPLRAGGATSPGPDVLAAYAALYLHAELDEAAVLPAVEALVEQRQVLALQDRATVQRLERFALSARDYPTRAERSLIFARLFGLGPAALRNARTMAFDSPVWVADDGARLDFRQRLLRLATAVVRAEVGRVRLGGDPGLASQAAWRAAAQDLQSLVSAQPAAALVQWARRIHARTLEAFAVLGDAGLQRQVNARTPWETLQGLISEEGAAARDAAARRGSAGQVLLRSLTAAPDEAFPDAHTVRAAMGWLVASGLPVPSALSPLPTGSPALPRTAFAVAAPEIAPGSDALAADARDEDRWAEVGP